MDTFSHQKGLPEVIEQGQETGPGLSVSTKPQIQGRHYSFISQSVIQQTHLEDLLRARPCATASGAGMPALKSSLFNGETNR